MRSKQYRRVMDKRKAHRKERIIRDVYCDRTWYESITHELNRLSKGKIHCSCPLCAFSGETMQDKRRREEMDDQIAEYNRKD